MCSASLRFAISSLLFRERLCVDSDFQIIVSKYAELNSLKLNSQVNVQKLLFEKCNF